MNTEKKDAPGLRTYTAHTNSSRDTIMLIQGAQVQERLLLHVGCGRKDKSRTTQGFQTSLWKELRLDIDPGVRPDVVASMTDMGVVADQSVDAIFSSHNLEHLYPHEAPIAISEFLRVLKHDGILVLTCPDLTSVCKLISEGKLTQAAYQSPAGPIAPLDILFGHRSALSKGNLHMAHRSGYSDAALRDLLSSVGFSSVATLTIPSKFELWSIATKSPCARAEMEALARVHFPLGKPTPGSPE